MGQARVVHWVIEVIHKDRESERYKPLENDGQQSICKQFFFALINRKQIHRMYTTKIHTHTHKDATMTDNDDDDNDDE